MDDQGSFANCTIEGFTRKSQKSCNLFKMTPSITAIGLYFLTTCNRFAQKILDHFEFQFNFSNWFPERFDLVTFDIAAFSHRWVYIRALIHCDTSHISRRHHLVSYIGLFECAGLVCLYAMLCHIINQCKGLFALFQRCILIRTQV